MYFADTVFRQLTRSTRGVALRAVSVQALVPGGRFRARSQAA